MSLTVTDQLSLLHDILEEHLNGNNGEINEYEQIKSLIKSMMSQEVIKDEELLSLLPEMYYYGILGEQVQNIEEHITSNQDSIYVWINVIKQINT